MPKLSNKLGRHHTNGSVCVYLEVHGFFELVSASYHTTLVTLVATAVHSVLK